MPLDYTARFWSKVDRSGGPDTCWLWLAGKDKDGYGQFVVRRLGINRAHRLSWYLAHGPIPAGKKVLHNCPAGDNPSCVNPVHLWLGTTQENVADRDNKGRTARGERSGPRLHPESYRGMRNSAKLTEEQVEAIRSEYDKGGATLRTLGEKYGVHLSTIHLVVKRKNWQNVA